MGCFHRCAARAASRAATLLVALTCAREARALDKQGAAHAGSGVGSSGFGLSGEVFLGALPYNPTYAARPDNSGLALVRAGAHLDIDVLGRRLFVPIDLNMFTDRQHQPLRPSEVDVIAGVATTWDLPVGAVEAGARGEMDAPADGRGDSQVYGDARVRYILSLAALRPGSTAVLRGGDLSGWVTLGWFALNPSYHARPDNTGLTLLRYAAHVDLGLGSHWSAMVDGTFFTDRTTNAVRPSELDLTVGMWLAMGAWRVQVAYERDMPVDGRGTGLVQHMAMVLGARSFQWSGGN